MPETPTKAFINTPGVLELYVQFRDATNTGSANTGAVTAQSQTPTTPLSSQAWQFVGTALQAPEPEESASYLEVFTDYAGRSVPHQLVYDGKTCLVPIILNRADLSIIRRMRDVSNQDGIDFNGADSWTSRGSLVIGQSDFSLYIKNTFFGTIQSTPGLPAGRLYYSAVIASYKESTVGTRTLDAAVVFKCHNVFLGPGNGFKLFSEKATDLPNLTPN